MVWGVYGTTNRLQAVRAISTLTSNKVRERKGRANEIDHGHRHPAARRIFSRRSGLRDGIIFRVAARRLDIGPDDYRWRDVFKSNRNRTAVGDARMKTGQQVTLKSGSPPMTVRCVVDYEAAVNTGEKIGVHVDWIDGNERLQSGVFYEEQLSLSGDES